MDTILLKDYIMVIRKHAGVFFSAIIICVVLAGVLTYIVPKSYTSSFDVYVRYKGENSSSFYTYDGYYSTQASVEYTDTVAGFLQSLSTVSDAANVVEANTQYENGGFQPAEPGSDPNYLASFQKSINVVIAAPQLIHVAITTPSSTVSQVWAQSLGDVLTKNLEELNQQGDSNFTINAVHVPITQTNNFNLTIDLVIGLIVGIFLGFVTGFIIEAYKK
jgi:capsular polysaccharide biosynthesis protein